MFRLNRIVGSPRAQFETRDSNDYAMKVTANWSSAERITEWVRTQYLESTRFAKHNLSRQSHPVTRERAISEKAALLQPAERWRLCLLLAAVSSHTSGINRCFECIIRLDSGICSPPLFRYWDRDLRFSIIDGVFLMVYFLPTEKGAMFQIVNNEKQVDHSNHWAIVLAGGEGTRVRTFLQQICGGSGLKQFSAIIDDRSMLRCTLDRVVRLIPPQRVLVVVSSQHREDAEKQLSDWPRENVIYQPANRDTAPGILLPLAHITHRDPAATVVVFPSDHFVQDEERFVRAVEKALAELKKNPTKMILLGMTPQEGEETEYGYIVPSGRKNDGQAAPVAGFVEKPSLGTARELIQRGALWNTMVFAVENGVLWEMAQRTSPPLYHAFRLLQTSLRSGCSPEFLEHLYNIIPQTNFSSAICEPLAPRLSVLPVPDVGWSDWGTMGSILRTLKKLGRFDALHERIQRTQAPLWRATKRPATRAEGPPLSFETGSS